LKVREIAEALVINAILLAALYWVTIEQATRAAYATQEGLAFLIARFPLTLTTTLSGRNGQLTSPLTLDWMQLIVLALLVVDSIYAYGFVRRRQVRGGSLLDADLRAPA
jgi:hypothetical protein